MTRRLALFLVLLACAPAAIADGPAAGGKQPWAWLDANKAEPEVEKYAPGVTPEEAALGRVALPAVAAIATTPALGEPAEDRIVGSGFFVAKDGVVATTWRVLSTVGPNTWLWVRPRGGTWTRAIPTGSTWLGDIGLARLVTRRRDFPTLSFADGEKKLGTRFVAVGAPMGRESVVSVSALSATSWFDATLPTGRLDIRKVGATKAPPKGGLAIGLFFGDDLSTTGGEGSPVLSGEGKVVGMVTLGDPARPPGEATFARPAELIRALVAKMLADATWDPPDLGMRFAPLPVAPGGAPILPVELERVRKKDKGGALVTDVAVTGPAQSVIWEGDVVLEIDKHPIFGDIYESYVPAILAMNVDLPTDVVLFRGGKRQSVQLRPHTGREIYGDFVAEHLARAGSLAPR